MKATKFMQHPEAIRPILITETGAEAHAATGWLGYVGAEVRQAQRMGAAVIGICLYPVMDYPGWDDERHCPCGLIEASQDWKLRTLRTELLQELHVQQQLFDHSCKSTESIDLLRT